MNILHINQADIVGGAAIAAFRLHWGLIRRGIDSKLLVGTVQIDDERVNKLPRQKKYIEEQLIRFTVRFGLNYINLISTFDIPNHPFYKQADVLNFHNLHDNYFNYLALPKLTRDKPAVYTLHDMWSFTGHCAYSYDCQRWQLGCGSCPHPDTYPAINMDNTKLEWNIKNWVYHHSKIVFVAPSRWLANQAQQSMLKQFPIHWIPNGIDIEVYRPMDRQESRFQLGLPLNKKFIMFTTASFTVTRKGSSLLREALQGLPKSLKQDIALLTIGKGGETIEETVDISTYNLGYLDNDHHKALAYSAADLFILPSQADNLPVTLQESMACGTPIISCNIGGISDLVRHTETGYLAKPNNVQDFREGIVQLLEDEASLENLGENCRSIAVEEYALELQAQRYVELYRSILQN